MSVNNGVSIEQKQSISLYQQQALNVLAMTNVELVDFLERKSEENPILDVRVNWIQYNKIDSFNQIVDKSMTLEDYLKGQIDIGLFSQKEIDVLYTLIGLIDHKGYLKESQQKLLQIVRTDEVTLYRLIRYIKQLDPVGVGSANFKECLKVQLEYEGNLNIHLEKIIDYHLEALAKGNFGKISKVLEISVAQVKAYYRLIKSLNPKPGNGFGKKDDQYVLPDLRLQITPEGYELTLDAHSSPQITMSRYWEKMMKEVENDERSKDYLKTKWEAAKTIVEAVENRKKTVLGVGKFIVERQYLYFKTGNAKYIRPLQLKEIASAVGVHESTVSRAIQTKYIDCELGVYPLKHFMASAAAQKGQVDMDNVSKESIKKNLQELVDSEDKKKPLSDQKLKQELEKMGFNISRRTIVKYREELHIGSSLKRGV